MEILHLISSGGFFGAENVVVELAKEQFRAGLRPCIGLFQDSRDQYRRTAAAVRRYELQLILFPCKGKLDISTVISIRRVLGNNRFDIVHSHNYKSNFYARLASLSTSVHTVATCHNWIINSNKLALYARLDKLLLNLFDKIVAVSDSVARQLFAFGVPASRIVTISNGVDFSRFSDPGDVSYLRRHFGFNSDCKIVTAIGRISQEKGHGFLLEAAKTVVRQYPDTQFLVVGDGPLLDELKGMCAGLPVKFTGSRDDIPQVLALADIFVLPSLTEGTPMVLLEAMSAGKPVVSTDVGAIPSILRHMENGLLVRPASAEQLASALLFLLANPVAAAAMGERARIEAQHLYSSQKMAESYLSLYRMVLKKDQ